jgi:hypothetical protein
MLENKKLANTVASLDPELGTDNGPAMYLGEDGELTLDKPPKKPFYPLTSDHLCTEDLGKCTDDAKDACTKAKGFFSVGDLCLGQKGRRCCFKVEGVALPTRDRKCTAAVGKCQLESTKCGATTKGGMCGGPAERKCCTQPEDTAVGTKMPVAEEPATAAETETPVKEEPAIVTGKPGDKPCWSLGGKCSNEKACTGKDTETDKHWRKRGLCTGSGRCCFSYDTQVHKEKCYKEHPMLMKTSLQSDYDETCHKKLGRCQLRRRDGGKCDGKENTGMCGGPSSRKCCIPPSK